MKEGVEVKSEPGIGSVEPFPGDGMVLTWTDSLHLAGSTELYGLDTEAKKETGNGEEDVFQYLSDMGS